MPQKIKWKVYTRGTLPLFNIVFAYFAHIKHCKKYHGGIFAEVFQANIGNKLWWCWNEEKILAIGKRILGIMKNKEKLDAHFKLMDELTKKTLASTEYLMVLYLDGDLKKLSDSELKQMFNKHQSNIEDANALMNADIDAVDIYPVEYLNEELNQQINEYDRDNINIQIDKKEFIKIKAEITAPAHNSYVQDEELDFLELVKEIIEKDLIKTIDQINSDMDNLPKEVYKRLKDIEKKYWWTTIGWEKMNPKTFQKFIGSLKEYVKEYGLGNKDDSIKKINKRIEEIKEHVQNIIQKRKELIKKYNISQENVNMIEAFDKYTYYHDLRKEMQMKSMYGFYVLLWEVCRRKDYREEDLVVLTYEEVADLLDDKENMLNTEKKKKELHIEIDKRKKASAVILEKDGIKILSGNEAIKKKEELLDSNIQNLKNAYDDSNNNEIHGQAASPGKTIGRVKVCAGLDEALNKVKEGDVLVTGMTLPEYLPAMKKASAIITDEGGITCHAAIVGRELSKPTIVGTKIATYVLKDDDLVEVDGNLGVIRKVK
ncbi:MAG: PEP-utilizing enzyme [Candidatus Woesearchaeota archaeon]